MEKELRRCGGSVELREDDGQPIIEGYGSVFYNPNDPGTQYELWEGVFERVMPGAFDEVIRNDDVRGLFNHDDNLVLGRTSAGTMTLSADSKGLRYSIVTPDTTLGRDLVTSLKRGDVTGSSIGFQVKKVVWIEDDDIEIREIHELRKLWDVGPVTFPAFEATTSGVRSLEAFRRAERQLLEAEREQGLARAAYRRRVVQMALKNG